ncbi:MAG TPA: hypothetical protein P5550_08020 [Bacteroidales bacterium]|nr:hypothetical protein [Bacteroidales bacterium]HRZ75894.1 hypothetical protein [Bacteroidales bacterium]
MQNNAFNIQKIHEDSARTLLERLRERMSPSGKTLVTVSGEVASGKSPVSLCLARLLKQEGVRAKLIDLDDFYRIPPTERRSWRLENGLESVGIGEINWNLLYKVIDDYRNNRPSRYPDVDLITDKVDTHETEFSGVEVLIIHGLYSLHIPGADLRVYMEMTWPETMDRQRESQKEVIDGFRLQVLRREQKVVLELKKNADIFIDLNTALEIYHL